MSNDTLSPVRIGPRRLGHVNLIVSNLDRSHAFYRDVCGLNLAFNEVDLRAKFLTNGNSHHDLALMEASKDELVGRDGVVQKRADDWNEPGLYHIAFEMYSEKRLVNAIQRAREANIEIHGFYDHLISRSMYLPDPDGIELEFYSDNTRGFRELYASLHDGLLSAVWEPEQTVDPTDTPHFVTEFEHYPEPGAIAPTLRTACAAIVVTDLERSIQFYSEQAGLEPLAVDIAQWRYSVFGGTERLPDLLLIESRGEPIGLHHFGLQVADVDELSATRQRLIDAGIEIVHEVDHPKRRGVVIIDPDGIKVEILADRTDSGSKVTYESFASADNRCWLV